MVIGRIDKITSKKITKKYERANKRQKYYNSICFSEKCEVSEKDSEMSVTEQNDFSDDSSLSSDSEQSDNNVQRNMVKLSTVARECDRYGVSNTAGAAIATAALVDYGIITKNDSNAVIDRSKLKRERQKLRYNLSTAAASVMSKNGPLSIYFDGRKDKTICSISVNSKGFVTEEHITLLEEPNSVYLGHVAPENGSSSSINEAILNFFNRNNISLKNLIAVGADGANVNTGVHRGVIRLLELHINHTLQWCICMFHCNELPLRHLMMFLDGTTQGPNAFNGVIGKQLQICNNLPVFNFDLRLNNLPNTLHDIPNMDISKDQKYLYDMCRAIQVGHVPNQLAHREPGQLVHSRWLTTANRILRLYVSTSTPSAELLLLTDYVLQVYAPVWFAIKLEPQCFKGSNHLWLLVKLSRFLPHEVRSHVDKCIQRNAFYAHTENILLAMLADDRQEIRELAVRRILKSREAKIDGIRKFVVPNINFNSENYYSLINWQEIVINEPPMMMTKTNNEIECIIASAQKGTLVNFSCHSQAVERHVKMVSEAAASVCGDLRRDGYIRAKILSRTQIPNFVSKKDWLSE